ncbi:glycoside hydrolase family 64 protein [Glycomyces buryatensis]|uniref:Sugar hydrolase n=1 Tax=Glycomyces buryatensis TaxID=2570927 RepID=A0A4S8PZ15_9ACTN|nr:glycoside hydrolase family 64 protein [Glycomyces buryatensis]THV36997.1 sugar hydrolase [Glycomyces buryatensis]
MLSRRKILSVGAIGTAAAAASAPWWGQRALSQALAAPLDCELALAKQSSNQINAYVTGREFGTDRMMLLLADGTPYYIEEPAGEATPLPVDAAIPLNASGADPKVVTLPRMYGSRIYFVKDDVLDFYVNPGPALVEPALHNPADSNYGKTVSFCEFTFNDVQLFVNLSYVDLVTNLPLGVRLQGDADKTVEPMPAGAVDAIASDLETQAAADGQPWDQLVLRGGSGQVLRVVSPQNLMAPYFGQPDMPFADYWTAYVDEVWSLYQGADLSIDLQGGRGVLTGRVEGENLVFGDGSSFPRPDARDIFTCDHGPFANIPTDSEEKKGLLARLAAAFNRSTIHSHPEQPNGAPVDEFYTHEVTNHYSRIVHANSPIGYAFPYDDVCPDDAPDQSGAAFDGNPTRLTVTAG